MLARDKLCYLLRTFVNYRCKSFITLSPEPNPRRRDIQRNDTQHNDIQHNDIQHDSKLNTTLSKMTVSIMLLCWVSLILSVNMLSVENNPPYYSECRKQPALLCWVSLCWVSLCWVALYWMSWRQILIYNFSKSNIRRMYT
jgi:hypothetical protein